MIATVALGCGHQGDSAPPPSSDGGDAGADSGVAHDCKVLCDRTSALGCEDAACASNCVTDQATAGACAEALGSYIHCLADNAASLTSCYDYPGVCESAHNAWASCGSDGGCGIVECKDAGAGACACQAFCSGALVAESCAEVAGAWDCTCSVDGAVVQTCPRSAGPCAFFVGCCASEL
jgi:hypothetical protein